MSSIVMERPGIELDERLKKANLNYRQFAKAIDVSPTCISQIISGKRSISMLAAQKIAKFFNEDFGYWIKKQADYSIYKQKNGIPI